MKFVRNIDNYRNNDNSLEEIRTFLHQNNDILAVPGDVKLILYYDGKPLTQIKNGKWTKYRKGYNTYIDPLLDSQMKKDLLMFDKKSCYFDTAFLKRIKDGISTALEKQVERKGQQVIASRHQSYDYDKYSICGIETTIPAEDISNTTRGKGKQVEIDMIAICPQKYSILLIEYKCKQAATTRDIKKSLDDWNVQGKVNKNLAEHFKDYLAVMESCKNEQFVKEIIKSYNYLAKLWKNKDDIIKIDNNIDAYVKNMKILFLFTDKPVKTKGNTDEIELTSKLYDNVKDYIKEIGDNYKEQIEKCKKTKKEQQYLTNFKNALYYKASSPNNVDLNEKGCLLTFDEFFN